MINRRPHQATDASPNGVPGHSVDNNAAINGIEGRSDNELSRIERKEEGEVTKTNDKDEGYDGDKNKDASNGRWKLDVALLLVLYALQGVPMGLSSTVDMLLRERGGIGYEAQAVYSMVTWPFSLKILWAPIVDSHHFPGYGRRKSWLVPIQILIAIMLFLTPSYVDGFIKQNTHHDSNSDNTIVIDERYVTHEMERVLPLVMVFFTFYFLAATQDIVVDGWAVEMLPPSHVSWASTCNSIGATFGYFISFTGFLGLKSFNLISLETFMHTWGFIFLAVTLLVALLKKEDGDGNDNTSPTQKRKNSHKDADMNNRIAENENANEISTNSSSQPQSIKETYIMMKKIAFSLPTVKLLIILLLTRTITFSASENLTTRKLMKEKGLNSEHVASLMMFITPISMILPGFISKKTAHKPLKLYMDAYIPRLLLGVINAAIYYCVPQIESDMPLPWYLFIIFFILSIAQTIVGTIQFVSIMAFFAKVSDPAIGGTYMTLLNTMANLGSILPNQMILFLINQVSWKYCKNTQAHDSIDCSSLESQMICEKHNGTCEIYIDGYYVLVAVCSIFGIFWYRYFTPMVLWLEARPEKEWRVNAYN